MPEEVTFQDLIRRVRAGDDEAAAELVRRYEPTIRRVARVRLADTRLRRVLDSMDICQSVFGSFFVRTALGQYDLDTPEQLLGLLIRMSQNKVLAHVRDSGAARRDYRRVREVSAEGRLLASADPSPSQQVSAQELLREFRRRLSEEERQLAEQRADGRDWAAIAAERGASPEALRKQLARAVARVAQELGMEDVA
jgi:RNA polymerase sigma-70 factor (ECF subfamily)